MKFSAAKFEKYCSFLRIGTKELGVVPMKWLGGQRHVAHQIEMRLAQGVHNFVILKGRQMGISTFLLALTLYWLTFHRNLKGALVTDTDHNQVQFRAYLMQYLKSLPQALRMPIVEHNRIQLILKNDSKLAYMTAGTRKNGSLGRGTDVNYLHATECSSWSDQEGLASLYSTLAQHFAERLYVFESTARGYNLFYEMYAEAQKAKTQRAIFVGWYRHEFYQYPKNHKLYKTYWDGSPTAEEAELCKEVWQTEKFRVTPEQIAWYRWKLAEDLKDESLMYQEFPWTPEMAFRLTGSKYFNTLRVNSAYGFAARQEAKFFRYKFGIHFEQTEIVETNEENAELTIWEFPVEKGTYVIGCDPAYGSSETADLFAISVWRCYADKLVQVAEVATPEWNEAQFAWSMAHLAGNFKPCMVNLEMQGPGGAVFNELQNLKRLTGAPDGYITKPDIYNVVGGIRDYLWRRQDSITGNYAYQWQTNAKEKNRMMATMRAYFDRDMLVIRSVLLCEQMRTITREGDSISGQGTMKDDLVIAGAIAIVAWNDWIMHEQINAGRTFERENRPTEVQKIATPLENSVMKYLKQNGIQYGPSRPTQ